MHASQGAEHDWNLLQICVSLLEYIGDFRLKLCELEKNIIQLIQNKKKEIDEDLSISYICSNYKITGKRELNDFAKLVNNSQTYSSFEKRGSIFTSVFDAIKPICEYIHDTTLAIIFAPIENQLKSAQFENSENMELTGLPDYSFAPQEFITVIGQVSNGFFGNAADIVLD